MTGVTDDPNDPALTWGVDDQPREQAEKYLVLSEAERAQGFVRPVRRRYVHATELGGCGAVTTMGQAIAETYARQPAFYGATFCVACSMHRPVGETGEFLWDDGSGQKVGTFGPEGRHVRGWSRRRVWLWATADRYSLVQLVAFTVLSVVASEVLL